MKLRERIHNFFYASTHANQLIIQNRGLLLEKRDLFREVSELSEELTSLRQQRRYLTFAIEKLTPSEVSLDTLRSICSEIDCNTPYSYDRVGCMQFGVVWQARFFLSQELRNDIDKYTYRKMLRLAGILPNNNDDTYEELYTKAQNAIGERFLTTPLPADMPVGKIDFIGNEGILYTHVFLDAGKFVCNIVDVAGDFEDASVTVYSDPSSGAHLDTSWVKSLGPNRLDVKVVPYSPGLYRTVNQLTKDEMDELRDALFHTDAEQVAEYSDVSDIPDSVVKEHFAGTAFVTDDFSCNMPDPVQEQEHDFEEEWNVTRVPATILPAGWEWVKYGDGSGHLEGPEGQQLFSYDLSPYSAGNGVEFKETDAGGWSVYWNNENQDRDFWKFAEEKVLLQHLPQQEFPSPEPAPCYEPEM